MVKVIMPCKISLGFHIQMANNLSGLIMGTVATGLTAGAGSTAIARMPHFTGQAQVQQGITRATSFTPMIVTLGGAGIVLKKVKKLEK